MIPAHNRPGGHGSAAPRGREHASAIQSGLMRSDAMGPTRPPLAAACQLILVTAADWGSTTACLQRHTRARCDGPWRPEGAPIPVCLGRAGLAWGIGLHPRIDALEPVKREGDGRSPAGIFAIPALFGDAPDGIRARSAQLPYHPTQVHLKAIDDPASIHYNQLVDQRQVARPDWHSQEDMARPDGRYALGAVIAHNWPQPVAGAGSCIFFHVWAGAQQPTRGCTAACLADVTTVCQWLDGAASPLWVQLPRAEHLRRGASWGLPPPASDPQTCRSVR